MRIGAGFALLHSRRHDHTTPWKSEQRFQFCVFRRTSNDGRIVRSDRSGLPAGCDKREPAPKPAVTAHSRSVMVQPALAAADSRRAGACSYNNNKAPASGRANSENGSYRVVRSIDVDSLIF